MKTRIYAAPAVKGLKVKDSTLFYIYVLHKILRCGVA